MKNMQSRNKKKYKVSLQDKIKRAYFKLPKWQQKYIAQNEIEEIRIFKAMQSAVESAQSLGAKVDIYQAFRQQAQSLSRQSGEGTLRQIFKKFREQVPLYYKYNSYMYRKGFSASNYYYNPTNSEITTEGYITTIITALPTNGSYSTLILEYHWGEDMFINADMY